nr:site-specific integrase [Candidatus Woesearchaeota archaeon]
MAENDIYNNKERYEKFISKLEEYLKESIKDHRRKYWIKNKDNLIYFRQLHKFFESKDNSYIRRLRLFRTLLMVSHVTNKDFSHCNREDMNNILAFSHKVNKSPKSKEDFVKDLKYLWKTLFPVKDKEGNIEDGKCPSSVSHLKAKQDKSKEKARNDRLTFEEYEKLVNYFNNNSKMQFLITLIVESLGRPQEVLYTKISNIYDKEDYATILVSEHGKEGTKELWCIDSYPYLKKYLIDHPYANYEDSYLFISNGKKDIQLKPKNASKMLKQACKKLEINKNITLYSLKRNGVTWALLRGDSEVEIMHRAGWSSTKQLQTYNLSERNDSLKKQLAKKGLLKDTKENSNYKNLFPETKECICGHMNGFSEKHCFKCKRILDRTKVMKKQEAKNEIFSMFFDKDFIRSKLKEFKEDPKKIEKLVSVLETLRD